MNVLNFVRAMIFKLEIIIQFDQKKNSIRIKLVNSSELF